MWKWISLLCLFAACAAPQSMDGASAKPLLNGTSLDGWRVLGGADFELVPTAAGLVLVGSGTNLPRNSFLVSEAEWGDFELELDVRIHDGNSGVQVRSHVDWQANDGEGHLAGYQIEVDPSERAWSGGLYDEGRRGWLDSNEAKSRMRSRLLSWASGTTTASSAKARTFARG